MRVFALWEEVCVHAEDIENVQIAHKKKKRPGTEPRPSDEATVETTAPLRHSGFKNKSAVIDQTII